MPHVNRLTEATIRNAIRRHKPYRLSDGMGLGLIVNPDGSKWWRFRYRYGLKPTIFKGKNREQEKTLSFGVYPEVRLAEARERRDECRAMLRKRVDPGAQRNIEKLASGDTVQLVAEEFLTALQRPSPKSGVRPLAAKTLAKARRRLQQYVYPCIGNRPIGLITVPELFAVLKKVQDGGKYETCKRIRQWCGKVWRHAVVTGRAPLNIVLQMRGAFIPVRSESHPAITSPARVGQLLRAIEGYTGERVTTLALKLEPYVFGRHVELRCAEWAEFDLARAEWRIPARRMKMREPHIVPLCHQALAILTELRALTAQGRYLFPNVLNMNRPMSENTLNGALRALGFGGEEMTIHGFRTLASTLLNEAGIDPDLIELQLAHLERDSSRRAYNRSSRMPARRKLMQLWGDALDRLRANVLTAFAPAGEADGSIPQHRNDAHHFEEVIGRDETSLAA
jgi:integrase